MRLTFRVDGSTRIGLGHLKRCASLSESVRLSGGVTHLVSRDLGLALPGAIRSQFDNVTMLPSPAEQVFTADDHIAHAEWAGVDQISDAVAFIATAQASGADWIVLDHYAFDARWIDRVRGALQCKVLVIDDLGDRQLTGDMLVDHNIDADHRAKHHLSQVERVMGGPRYALLSRKYAAARRYGFSQDVRSVGIFMGGADADNVSSVCLEACRAAGFQGKISIATTSANPHIDELTTVAARDGNAQIALDLPDLTDFFAEHDLQIGAGGGATWERCCIGAPAIVVQTAINQAVPLEGLRAMEAAVTCSDAAPATLAAAVRNLIADPAARRRLSARAATLVDGRGCDRVAISIGGPVTLRLAAADDALLAFQWRNHPQTRKHSHDASEIAWAGHADWWSRSMADPDRLLMIAMVGQIPVGVLRLDREAQERARVSIYVDPALTGLGLGQKMLERAADAARGEWRTRSLTASIKADNAASRRAFAAAGFQQEGDDWVHAIGVQP